MNTEWNSYLMDVLIPQIHHDLRLEVGFRLSLYKLLLYKTGSFFKPHRDSEKEDGMFGTVVIQLPSIYDGGKLVVRHNHRTEEVDLSSAITLQNGFSIHYTAFYCDCEHEVLPVTKGVRACLVYNLVMTCEITETTPSAARLEVEGREADLVDLLQNYWPNDQKVIYCLSHKYSQKNLSLKNLKSTDRIIAQFFQKYADSCSLEVMIGILKRKKYRYAQAIYKPRKPRRRRSPNLMYHYNLENGYEFLNHNYYDNDDDYEEIATISDVDSEDPNVTFYDDYEIKYLKPIDKDRHNCLPSMEVNFEKDVLPENSFQNIKAFDEDQEVTGNEGVKCSKFYQCAAIMIFHRDDLVPILVRGDAKGSKVEEFFLHEFEKNKENFSDKNIKAKFLRWAEVIVDNWLDISRLGIEYRMVKRSKMIDIFLLLDNVELLQKYLRIEKFEDGDFSYVYEICHKHGWMTFSGDIISKFAKLKPDKRIENVQKFIDYKNEATFDDVNKQSIIDNILKEILTKFEYELKHPPREPWHRYPPRPLNQDQRIDKTKKLLISLWPIAMKVNFLHLADYTKSKSMKIVVPVLIAVAQNKEISSNHIWIDIANYFKLQMESFLGKPINPTFTWKQNVNLSCHCKHCQFVEDFLQRPYQQTLDFFGKKPIREHVQKILAGLENVTFSTTQAGVLRIKKPKKTGEIESKERQFVETNLSTLCALIEATCE